MSDFSCPNGFAWCDGVCDPNWHTALIPVESGPFKAAAYCTVTIDENSSIQRITVGLEDTARTDGQETEPIDNGFALNPDALTADVEHLTALHTAAVTAADRWVTEVRKELSE